MPFVLEVLWLYICKWHTPHVILIFYYTPKEHAYLPLFGPFNSISFNKQGPVWSVPRSWINPAPENAQPVLLGPCTGNPGAGTLHGSALVSARPEKQEPGPLGIPEVTQRRGGTVGSGGPCLSHTRTSISNKSLNNFVERVGLWPI